MNLFTQRQLDHLLNNGARNNQCRDTDGNVEDFYPVVKLFAPWSAATWLFTELDPDDRETLFGLCDLGVGEPELGYVGLVEIMSIRGGPFRALRIERDLYFKPRMRLSEYADEARKMRRIVA